MKKKPKVLMIGPGRNVKGGISSVINTYYEGGLDKKIDLRYISSMQDGNKIWKLLVAARSYLLFCLYLKRYDIVHVHMASNASYRRKNLFVRKAKRAHKKVIIHVHGGKFNKFFLNATAKQQKKIKETFSLADTVIVLSDGWAGFFQENICDANKVLILNNGVMIHALEKENYEDHGVLFLGRLNELKGTHDLLRVIPIVAAQIPDVMFYLAGDGEVEKTRRTAQTKGLEKNVSILGWISGEEKRQYLEKCSIYILPSYHEGMPMSVLEAMNYGLATVSTDVGGIREIICDGENGYLVKPGDINSMAERLIALLQNPELKKEIGLAGKETIVHKFYVQNNLDALYQLYYTMG